MHARFSSRLSQEPSGVQLRGGLDLTAAKMLWAAQNQRRPSVGANVEERRIDFFQAGGLSRKCMAAAKRVCASASPCDIGVGRPSLRWHVEIDVAWRLISRRRLPSVVEER
jgi:hypothetical protein